MAINNLFEYYQSKGQTLPSVQERSKIFESSGLGSAATYSGTADQNTSLLSKLLQPTKTQAGSATFPPGSVVDTGTGPKVTPGAVSSSDEIANADAAKLAAQAAEDQKKMAELERARVDKELADIKGAVIPTGSAQVRPSLEGEFKGLLGEEDASGNSLQEYQQKLTENRARRDEISAEVSTFAQTGAEGQPQGAFLTRLSEAERNAQFKLDALDREANVINQQITNRTNVINTLMGLKKEDYANSTAEYDKQFSQNLQIQNLLQGVETRRMAAEERAQDNARANLKIIQDGIKGMDYNALDETTRATIDSLEVQAGFPAGFTQFITGNVKGDIVSTNSRVDGSGTSWFDVLSKEADGSLKVTSIWRGADKSGDDISDADDIKAFQKAAAEAILRIDKDGMSYEPEFRALKAQFPMASDAAIYAIIGEKQ